MYIIIYIFFEYADSITYSTTIVYVVVLYIQNIVSNDINLRQREQYFLRGKEMCTLHAFSLCENWYAPVRAYMYVCVSVVCVCVCVCVCMCVTLFR